MDALKTSKQKELASLLSYGCLYNDETVFHKDGAFSASFYYVAQDVDSATSSMLDANAYAVLSALNLLDDGFMVETNLISERVNDYPDKNHFTNTVAALIDDARRFHFQEGQAFYKSSCYLTISYVPVSKSGKKLIKALMEEGSRENTIEQEHQHFEKICRQFITHFEKITVVASDIEQEKIGKSTSNLLRLKGDRLISFLNQTITGDNRFIKSPKAPYFLDFLLSNQDFVPGLVPTIGNKYVTTLVIDDLPEFSYPAILDVLNYIGCKYRWSNRYIALSKTSADKYLKRIETRWSNQAIGGLLGLLKMSCGFTPKLNKDAHYKQLQAEDARAENSSGELSFGFMTSVIVLMEEDREVLQENAEKITNAIENLYFKVREEALNATEAYLGSIPGHGMYNVRKPICDSMYAAHAFPTSSIWPGDVNPDAKLYPKDAPALMKVRTKGTRVMNFNFHVADVGHFLVIGPTGGGKSTLVQLEMAQFMRYQNARVIAFDKDNSHMAIIKMLGGDYYDAMGGDSFSPLEALKGLDENSAVFDVEISSIKSWVEHICVLQNVEITPNRSKQIRQSILDLYKSGGELRLDLLSFQEPEIREAFFNFLQGPAQNILLGIGQDLSQKDVIGFDVTKLLKMDDKDFIPIMEAFFNRITRVFRDQRPTLLLIEEASKILTHPIFKVMVDDWLTTLRKFNVCVGLIFQDPSQITRSGIDATLKSQCFTKIYLPNKDLIGNEQAIEAYKSFGLNEQQVSILGHAIPLQDYYLTSPKGNRLFQLDLDVLSLAFVGVSSQQDYKKLDELIGEGENWVSPWLCYKGLSDWGSYVSANYELTLDETKKGNQQ